MYLKEICFSATKNNLFFSLKKTGKRPHKPTVIPLFKPPGDISPAAVSYLLNKNFTKKPLAATFIDMAVKGSMTIACDAKKNYSFINKRNVERLRPVERKIHNTLLGDDREMIEVAQKNHVKFSTVNTHLESSVKNEYKLDDYYADNDKYVRFGGLTLLAIFVLYIICTFTSGTALISFSLASPLIVWAFLKMLSSNYKLSCMVSGCAFTGAAILCFSIIMFLFSEKSLSSIHWFSLFFFVVMTAAYLHYVNYVRMFTHEGAKLISELEGLKMYMETAEEHRLNMLVQPEKTLDLFEKLLPYALALGVSNEWCKKFDAVLSRIDYHPEWYDSRDDLRKIGYATAFASLASSFGTSVVSAKTAQTTYSSGSYSSGSSSWSSGSSGGGYSGGGGGGGGGRGW